MSSRGIGIGCVGARAVFDGGEDCGWVGGVCEEGEGEGL